MTPFRPLSHLVCLALVLTSLPVVGAGPSAARQQIITQHAEAQKQFATNLDRLRLFCAEHRLPEDAAYIEARQAPFDQLTIDVDTLPEAIEAEIPADLPADERQWRVELRDFQHDYAAELYSLAQRSLREAWPSYAFQLLREVALHAPDHEIARRALGYVRYADRWVTPYTALMLRKGQVWHPRFGWLPKDHVDRYVAGQRYFDHQWMTAAREALLRGTMANGWVVESDHFVVRTNESLEKAVELSQALEDLHRFFVREFSDLFTTPQQMQALFGSGKPRSATGPGKHDVWYFRTAGEFEQFIVNKQPALKGVNGVYLPSERCAYFYANPADPQRNIETMYHEVTHQILSESGLKTFAIAEDRDFWIVEGFACYMESFDRTQGRLTIGSPRHPRIHWAKVRVATENWFIPTAEFTSFGMRQFQFDVDFPTLQKYYSQATGLTHFLLHYDGGRYRDGCIQYLAQLYSPDKRIRLAPQELPELLGVPYETLDTQYKAYISGLDTTPLR
jgi:hypothetical protein